MSSTDSLNLGSNVMESLKSIQNSMPKMNESLYALIGEVTIIRAEMDQFSGMKDSLEFTQSQLDDVNNQITVLKAKAKKVNESHSRIL